MNNDVYGMFDYAPISYEIFRLRKEVEDLNDEVLIEVISDVYLFAHEIDDIIAKFAFTGVPMTPDEREKLIGFYILANIDADLEIDE